MDRINERWLFATLVFVVVSYLLIGLVKMVYAADTQVLVIRYYSTEGGPVQAVTASYGWTAETCEARKRVVDKQPDPSGTKTIVVCVNEADLPALLEKGERI